MKSLESRVKEVHEIQCSYWTWKYKVCLAQNLWKQVILQIVRIYNVKLQVNFYYGGLKFEKLHVSAPLFLIPLLEKDKLNISQITGFYCSMSFIISCLSCLKYSKVPKY